LGSDAKYTRTSSDGEVNAQASFLNLFDDRVALTET
jgi:hypothetical protein